MAAATPLPRRDDPLAAGFSFSAGRPEAGSLALRMTGTPGAEADCPHMAEWAQRVLTGAGTWLARPWAVGAVFTFVVLWIAFDPHNFGWHGVATIATLLMTLLIQRSEHRDTQAIHAKLDELLRVNGKAQNQLATLDDKEPEQVEAFRTRSRPAE